MDGFVLSETSYNNFIKTVDLADLKYVSEAERAVEDFEEDIKESAYYAVLKDDIDALKEEIKHNQREDLLTYQTELKQLIGEQIVGRYFLTKGEIANSLAHDPDVKEAVKVLNDSTQYSKLLQASN